MQIVAVVLQSLNPAPRLREAAVNWFPWVVVIAGAAVLAFTSYTTAEVSAIRVLNASRLEQVATGWILFGALWTALGNHLTSRDSDRLDQMAASGVINAAELVRMLKATSRFATSGALMILLGSGLLLYTTTLPNASQAPPNNSSKPTPLRGAA